MKLNLTVANLPKGFVLCKKSPKTFVPSFCSTFFESIYSNKKFCRCNNRCSFHLRRLPCFHLVLSYSKHVGHFSFSSKFNSRILQLQGSMYSFLENCRFTTTSSTTVYLLMSAWKIRRKMWYKHGREIKKNDNNTMRSPYCKQKP